MSSDWKRVLISFFMFIISYRYILPSFACRRTIITLKTLYLSISPTSFFYIFLKGMMFHNINPSQSIIIRSLRNLSKNIKFDYYLLSYHTGTKWHERKSCHLEKLLSKRNSNYRNTPYTTNYQISKRHFPAKKYNPYEIYQE